MKRSICIFFICFWLNSYSQKYEMGKVSIKELQEKTHPSDTSAIAAVLYKKEKTSFRFSEEDGFTVVHDFEIRIKIYKNEGLNLANYEIPYYIGYEKLKQDNIHLWEASTYNLVDGKIEKTKLTGTGIFKEKVNKDWKILTFTLPKVRIGSVVEFKYSIKSENILFFPEFEFQREIPVGYAEYQTEIPVYFVYKKLLKGYIDVKTESKVTTVSNGYTDQYNNSQTAGYKAIITTHVATDIPAIKKEEYIDNLDNYTSAVNYELEVIRRPEQPDENLAKTWEGVTKTIYDDKDFGKQLNTRQYFETDIERVVKGVESKEEKVNAIFNYVKTKMHWNKQLGIYTEEGVKKAYLDRTGNVAEINFILISMLNASGLAAYPVLVSTIKNGVASFPNRTAFNYVIGLVEIDGKRLLLDATGDYTTPGILPEYVLNRTGRLIRQNGDSEEINLAPAVNSKNTVTVLSTIDKEGKMSGKVRVGKNNYEALAFREEYTGTNSESYQETLENLYGGLRIKNYIVENEKNIYNPIQETFDFTSDNTTEIIGDKMYINPLLFYSQTKNPFIQEERKLPVFFGYPKQNRYTINIEIPDGYTVESIPQSLNIKTEENIASYKFNIQVTANKILIVVTTEINNMLVAPEFYPTLKDYYKKIIDKQNEKIVLKKV